MKNIQKFTKSLQKKFNDNNIRSAFIQSWLSSNNIKPDLFDKEKQTCNFLNKCDQYETDQVYKKIITENITLDLKCLEGVFELLIDSHRRKSQGAVYTPNYIINSLLVQSFSQLNEKNPPKFCDPACGSGGFILGAATKIKEKYNLSIDYIFNNLLYGIDNDEFAVSHCKCLLELYLSKYSIFDINLDNKIIKFDTLINETDEILNKFSLQSKFDLISTNPPYVKLQSLDIQYRNRLSEIYKKYTIGSFSLSPLFLIKSLDLINENGCISVITQNNLFTSLSGKKIREKLQKDKNLTRIIDFGHLKIFDNASAYTCLLFLNHKDNSNFEYKSIKELPEKELLNIEITTTINSNDLNPSKWRLAEKKHLCNLKKLETQTNLLGHLCDIKVGFATLKDNVYFTRLRNGSCYAKSPEGEEIEIESNITKSAIKIAEIKDQQHLKNNDLRIIFPYEKVNGKFRPIPENIFKNYFPLTYNHLKKWEKVLLNRDKGKKTNKEWYAWGREQGMTANGPKLLTKTFNSKPTFILDNSDSLFCNGYSVTPQKSDLFNEEIPIETLQKILCSKLMHYYTKLTSFQLEGNYQCYQKNFIENFSIPEFEYNKISLMEDNDEIDMFLCNIYNIDYEDIIEILD